MSDWIDVIHAHPGAEAERLIRRLLADMTPLEAVQRVRIIATRLRILANALDDAAFALVERQYGQGADDRN